MRLGEVPAVGEIAGNADEHGCKMINADKVIKG